MSDRFNEMRNTIIDKVKGVKFVHLSPEIPRRTTASLNLILYPEDAEKLKELGWTIKEWKNPNSVEEDDVEYSITVYISYFDADGKLKSEDRLPRISQVIGTSRTFIGPDVVAGLQNLQIINVKAMINPYRSRKDPTKVTAYAKQMVFEIDPYSSSVDGDFVDAFAEDYPVYTSSFEQ